MNSRPALALVVGALAFALGGDAAWAVNTLGKAKIQPKVQFTPKVQSTLPAGWREIASSARNLSLFAHEEGGKLLGNIAVSTESLKTLDQAVRRLVEIAEENLGTPTFTTICGWPALERRYRARSPVPEALGVKFAPSPDMDAVTAVVAQPDGLIRFQGVVTPGVPGGSVDKLLQLARSITCPKNPAAPALTALVQSLRGRVKLDLAAIQRGLPAPARLADRAAPGAAAAAPRVQQPTLALKGFGELQVAASKDGRNVVVATNSIFRSNVTHSFSTDGGARFTEAINGATLGFANSGDPTLGVGVSRSMYYGVLGRPGTPQNACTASVMKSGDNGKTFQFAGHAAISRIGGPANQVFFPDQEFLGVDRVNGPGDQLYMVWRHFIRLNATACNNIGGPGLQVVPAISCSKDGGRTWTQPFSWGAGDHARLTVGPDGTVFVTSVTHGNQNVDTLNMERFTSCARGFQRIGGTTRVARFVGAQCPYAGVDRCDDQTEASPQPAVDETNARRVLVAWVSHYGGSDNVVVGESRDGGENYKFFTANTAATAQRYLPWICMSKGIAHVTWYDRRAASAARPDLTAYFWGQLSPGAAGLVLTGEVSVSGANDPQCASGFPAGVRSANDSTSCKPPQNAAVSPSGGAPKFGDYNGNDCADGKVFMAWASATPPAGVRGAPAGINVYAAVGSLGSPAPPPPPPPPPPPADCPQPATVSVERFGQYQDGIASLPADQRTLIDGVVDTVVKSFKAGCRAFARVSLVGHADKDPTKSVAFHQDISQKRAQRVADQVRALLQQKLGANTARVTLVPSGVGFNDLKHAPASGQRQMEENRRVILSTSF